MMNRRVFLQAVAAAGGFAQDQGLTTISYNVLACLGFARSADNQKRLTAAKSQMETRMAQELALYQPNIVSFSESVMRDAAARIARHLGMQFAYFEPGVASYPGYPIGFPGTVFTKHKIVESQNAPCGRASRDPELFTRHWGRAVIETPGESVVIFSGHLHPNNQQIREQEIGIMLSVMSDDIKRGRSLLFQGDLNHTPEAPEYKRWKDAGLTDTFAAAGTGESATFSTREPKRRLDYLGRRAPCETASRSAGAE